MTSRSLDTMEQLPKMRREAKPKWELFNAYNLRTIRDTFVFVAQGAAPTRKELFQQMEKNIIKPPGKAWSGVSKKRPNRIEVEYLQACKYLGLLEEKEGSLSVDNLSFQSEKELILSTNRHRIFSEETSSPPFLDQEKESWITIIRNYPPAAEYLWWFMDAAQFESPHSFSMRDFSVKAGNIYLLTNSGKKAPEVVYRTIDKKDWLIPFNDLQKETETVRTEDYTRLMEQMFPSWFEDLGVLDTMKVLDEFSFRAGNWEMHYPLSKVVPSIEQIEQFIQEKFNDREKRHVNVLVPVVIYEIALAFRIPVATIKDLIVDIYLKYDDKYLLERSSLQVMSYANQIRNSDAYKKLFINYREFYRNYLTFKN